MRFKTRRQIRIEGDAAPVTRQAVKHTAKAEIIYGGEEDPGRSYHWLFPAIAVYVEPDGTYEVIERFVDDKPGQSPVLGRRVIATGRLRSDG